MSRLLTGLLGAIAAVFPDGTIDVFERVAIENPDECERTTRARTTVRAEAIVVAVVCLVGGRAYAGMMGLTGAFGAVVFFFPDLYRRFATRLLYERPSDVRWNDRFTDVVRVVGALYVLLAIRALGRRRKENG